MYNSYKVGILETKGPNLTTYFILAAAAMVSTSTIQRLSQSLLPVQLQQLQESVQVALRLRSHDLKTQTLEHSNTRTPFDL